MRKEFPKLVVGMLVMASLIGAMNLMSYNAQATPVSGQILIDTTWDTAGSPYIVVGNVTVVNGVTLTVDPGVDVKFDGYFALFVDGTMNANGNNGNMVTFTSNSMAPNKDDWFSIYVNSTGKVSMDYCDVSYSTLGILLNYSSNNVISNSDITMNNLTGIYLMGASNSEIIDNDISSNTFYGIFSFYSEYVNITDSRIIDNEDPVFGTGYGIYLFGSNHTRILNNNISFNGAGFGGNVFATDSSNNTIEKNEVFGGEFGIYFISALNPSSDNVITGNEIGGATGMGLTLAFADDNEITYNNVSSNGFTGISLMGSSYNLLHHNNIVENGFQAMDDSNDNIWNESYSNGGGNYWSNWDTPGEGCSDNFDGPITPQTGGNPDGICDDQYGIDADSIDFYPLTEPWGGGLPVDTTPPVITNLQPADSSTVTVDTPTISADYSDPSGIDISSVRLEVNGIDETSSATITAGGVTYTPSSSMGNGVQNVYLEVNDTLGNQATISWSFIVDTTGGGGGGDTTPPTISGLTPSDQSTISDKTPTISADFSDSTGINVTSVVLKFDGEDVTSSATVTQSGVTYIPSAPLADGEYEVYLEVADNSTNNNKANKSWSFTVETSDGEPDPTSGGDFLSDYWWLILIIIIVIVVLLALVLLLRRKKKPEAAAPGTQTIATYPPQATQKSSQAEQTTPAVSTCKNCGTALEPNFMVCPNCGTKI
jgi:parallel beta-helix repeat protein